MQQPDRGKVVFVTGRYLPSVGGTETIVHNMAEQLLRQGYRVHIFTAADGPASQRHGLSITRIAPRRLRGLPAPIASWWLAQRRISDLLDRETETPVAVHVFDAAFGWSAVNWARRNGVRSVVTLTSDDVTPSHGLVAGLRGFFAGRTLKHAGLVTSPSHALAELATESRGARDVHVVPHGIDFTAAAGVENAFHIRRRFGIPADAFVFLAVQRLYPGKTPVNAVRAFARATTQRSHAYMLIVGEGPGRAAVERIAVETGAAGRVLLPGAVPPQEIATYMRASDAFVLDTAFESFGMAAVEAMAAGLPIVGTRAGAIPEIIEDGRTGLLSRFGDVDAMAEAMRRVMTNPELRELLKVEARKAAASFDWSSIAEQYTAGYGAA